MNSKLITVICLILLAAILLCWGIFLPYTKAWEVGSLEFLARNHILYGLNVTKGIPVVNFIDGKPNYYTSHPPLIPLLLMWSFKLFGIHEWSARLVPIIFSLVTLLFFYLLIEYICSRKIALLASVFVVFMPMFSYYGRIVNYEAITLGLLMIFLYSFIKFTHTRRRVFLIMLIIVTIFGSLSDWPFYLVFLILPIYIKIQNTSIKSYFGLAILALATFIGIILMYNYAIPTSMETQFNAFSNRCQYGQILTNFSFYKILIKRSLLNFTPFCNIFLLIWLVRLLKQKDRVRREINLFAGVLFLFGVVYVFITPQATYIHDWSFQYLVPAIAFISALVVIEFKKRWQLIFIILFIISSLVYLTKLHLNKILNETYVAGRMISRISSLGDILYTNTISPVCFYSGVETHFFAYGSRPEKNTEEFISTKSPAFICILQYASEPRFVYEKMANLLGQKNYQKIYDEKGVVLWKRRS